MASMQIATATSASDCCELTGRWPPAELAAGHEPTWPLAQIGPPAGHGNGA